MTDTATALASRYLSLFPGEAAQVLQNTDPTAVAVLLTTQPAPTASAVLGALSATAGADVLSHLDVSVAGATLADMEPVRVAPMLRRLSAAARESLLNEIPARRAAIIRRLLAVRADSAGARMDPTALALPADLTAEQALAAVRREPARVHGRIFVVDSQERLLGAVDTISLVTAEPEKRIADCGVRRAGRVQHDHPLPTVAQHPGWTRWATLPVVDEHDRFVGVLHRDVVEPLRSRRNQPSRQPLSLALSVAELLWTGMAAMTGGVTRQPTKATPSAARVGKKS